MSAFRQPSQVERLTRVRLGSKRGERPTFCISPADCGSCRFRADSHQKDEFQLIRSGLRRAAPDPVFSNSVTKDIAPGLVIEAALLTSPKPLKIGELSRLFAHRYTKDRITQELGKLAEFWQNRGLRLVEVGDGWRFQSVPEIAGYLVRLVEEKAPKYSRAVMETLAIIAYRQPATRGDIEEIRGVAVNPNILRQLEERGWIEVIGHRESPGRPALFATTPQFLNDLGLKSLAALPPLKGETPQAQEFELDFSDKTIRERTGQETAAAPIPTNEAETASTEKDLKLTAAEAAEETNK